MAIELSTAGIRVKYAMEATAGTRPTTNYTAIPGVKSIPDINPEPGVLDVTTLDETAWHRYIQKLRDMGGAIGLTVNHYKDFVTAWETMLSAYATAKASDKAMWVEIVVPTLDDSFYFSAEPSELGFGGAEVDAVLENIAYLTPNKVAGWVAASTTSP